MEGSISDICLHVQETFIGLNCQEPMKMQNMKKKISMLSMCGLDGM